MTKRKNRTPGCSRTMERVMLIWFFCAIPHSVSAQEHERLSRPNAPTAEPTSDEGAARRGREEYEAMRLMDPATYRIPENIRTQELQFASRLLTQRASFKDKGASTQSVYWTLRGPANIGGRTDALGIDVANEQIILAGGTTGGMWRSSDRGISWVRTTPVSVLPSTTCLAQDTRAGKRKTWYYGTGEFGTNTGGYPIWLNEGGPKWGEYYGNGIFKSADNGLSWNVLHSTTSDTIGALVQPFNFVRRIALDLSNDSNDVVYAAVPGGVERSSDGGATWKLVLGSFPDGVGSTDVAVTSKGVVYAVIGSNRFWSVRHGVDTLPSQGTEGGIFRSSDGIHWVNISPKQWSRGFFKVFVAPAPSNDNVVYFAFDSIVMVSMYSYDIAGMLWKYTYVSGDGSGSGGAFKDRSANVPETYLLKVKPNDENTVFVGGVRLNRSTDGFATQADIVDPPHPDDQSIAFFPSNASSMIMGTDGGLFMTENNLASPVQWSNLNNGYVTTQFYTVAIDHSTPGDPRIVGGLQDNFTNLANSPDATQPWVPLSCCDGATCAISDQRSSYYVSSQWGMTYRKVLDDQGGVMDYTRIDPIGSTHYVWINPFTIDPNNNNRMYFGGGSFLWRNDDVTLIPLGGDAPTSVGWKKLTHTTLQAIDSIIHTPMITTITSTKAAVNRVYYGTSDGRLFRVDSANTGDPTPKAIWEGKGFPKLAFVSSIAADSKNADNVIVAFANYNVQSLFYSSDGGTSWTPIGGNLEEHPDGSGSGPSFRTAAIMHSGNGMIYLAGTSTGLYSTSTLNGMSTQWTLEGPTAIGNNIVNMIDTRESDGMVAVATCGHGVFSGNFAPASSVSAPLPSHQIQFSPNPTTALVTVHGSLSSASHVIVSNILGELMIEQQAPPGTEFTLDLSSFQTGTYYVRITSPESTTTGVIVKE